MEYKKQVEQIIEAKIFALKNLGKYRKAVPIVRIDKLWLEESDFKILFDLPFLQTFPMVNLCIGDFCKIKNDFYVKLLTGLEIESWNGEQFIEIIEELKGNKNNSNKLFSIIAFVEMNGKHGREIFCVLRLKDNSRVGFDKIIETTKGSLLLFWPQSLEKID